jgi:hypothetical protein
MPEVSSSSSRVFSSTEVSGSLWSEKSIATNLPYRDVMMDDLNLGHIHIVADREWVVGIAITMTSVREFCVYILKLFRCEADHTHQQEEGSFVRITVHHSA